MNAYKLFTPEEARELCEALSGWAAGTASNAVTVTKRNDEIRDEALSRRVSDRVLAGPIPRFHFVSEITPPKFSRYRDGGEYGIHADAAQMHGLRTDLACTLFLNDGYEGGELCVAGHEVKLPPGEAIVYECWRPHRVKPVTQGERIAAVFWLQSYIRTEEQRDILGMLRGVTIRETDEDTYAVLGAIHEKLVKLWWA